MRKIFITLLTTFILLSFTACINKADTTNELLDYHNNNWIPISSMKKGEIDIAQKELLHIVEEFGENDVEKIVTIYREDIIPVGDKVVERFTDIQIKHKKIKRLNELQIEAEEVGRSVLKSGIDFYKGDLPEGEYRKLEDKLKKKYDEIIDYREKLMDKYNLEYDYEKGSIEGYYEIKRAED